MKYSDYHKNKNVEIFEPIVGDNYFAGNSNYYTYMGSYDEIGCIDSAKHPLANNIYLDAYVNMVLKRHTLLKDGKVILLDPYFNDGHATENELEERYVVIMSKPMNYIIDSWRLNQRSHILRPDNGEFDCNLEIKKFKDVDSAIEEAKRISKENTMSCVVAYLMASVDFNNDK